MRSEHGTHSNRSGSCSSRTQRPRAGSMGQRSTSSSTTAAFCATRARCSRAWTSSATERPARARSRFLREGAVSIEDVPELASDLPGLALHSRGKVREMYDLGERLLMVASDRISAYDVVLPTAIPDKGRVLTGLSVFWFERSGEIVRNHLVSLDVPPEVKGRALVVERLEIFPIECVVRGYLSGSGWREYRQHGSVCGIELPAGLREADRLPEPIFTPATKAET